MKTTLLQQADQIPPCICRLFARKLRPKRKRDRSKRVRRRTPLRSGYPSVAKTLDDIQKESGLSERKVHWIAALSTWAQVEIQDAMAFSAACGVDLLRPGGKLDYLKKLIIAGTAVSVLGRGLPSNYVERQLQRLNEKTSGMDKQD